LNPVLGLHVCPGSYSDRWVEYCRERGIPFKEVDPFRPDFMQQVAGLEAFAWHWAHGDARAAQIARQVQARSILDPRVSATRFLACLPAVFSGRVLVQRARIEPREEELV
jgi:hypothetical protein